MDTLTKRGFIKEALSEDNGQASAKRLFGYMGMWAVIFLHVIYGVCYIVAFFKLAKIEPEISKMIISGFQSLVEVDYIFIYAMAFNVMVQYIVKILKIAKGQKDDTPDPAAPEQANQQQQ